MKSVFALPLQGGGHGRQLCRLPRGPSLGFDAGNRRGALNNLVAAPVGVTLQNSIIIVETVNKESGIKMKSVFFRLD